MAREIILKSLPLLHSGFCYHSQELLCNFSGWGKSFALDIVLRRSLDKQRRGSQDPLSVERPWLTNHHRQPLASRRTALQGEQVAGVSDRKMEGLA